MHFVGDQTMDLITLFVAIFLVLISWWYYTFFKYRRYFAKYDGPTPLPITGNVHKISSPTDIIPVIMDFHKNHGPVITMWIGYSPRLIISDYKTAEVLLGSTDILEKSYDYHFFKPWLGTGLLTSTGSKWKKHRKLITPAFHFQILEQFIETFHAQTDILVEKLRGVADGSPFDVYPYINLCALDIICEATMGTQVNAQKHADSSYVRSVKEICRIISDRSISATKMFDCLYPISRDYWKEKKALSILHGYTNSVIRSRQNELNAMVTKRRDSEVNLGIKKRHAFLDLLLQCQVDGATLSTENIREEVDTFLFEGHDTTSSGVSFALYCLSRNISIQNKVLEELRSILGHDRSGAPTYQNLQNLKYLEMALKESMRLYPPVPLYAREVIDDTEFDGTVFPKGSTFAIFTYGLHRQEEMFPDPEKFDPERFTVENSAKRSPFAYVPFSAGPRNCIGQRFAMLEMKAMLAKILRNFEVLPVLEYKPVLSSEVILKSTNGILIRLKERQL